LTFQRNGGLKNVNGMNIFENKKREIGEVNQPQPNNENIKN